MFNLYFYDLNNYLIEGEINYKGTVYLQQKSYG